MIKKALSISAGIFLISLLGIFIMFFVFIWTDKITDIHINIMSSLFVLLAISGLLTSTFGQMDDDEQKTKGDA